MKTEMDIVIETLSRLSNDPARLEEGTLLVEEGHIDSLKVFHVIAELERIFQIRIGAMDATMSDFRTPRDILDLVERVRANQ